MEVVLDEELTLTPVTYAPIKAGSTQYTVSLVGVSLLAWQVSQGWGVQETMLGLFLTILAQLLVLLGGYWSVPLKAWLTTSPARSLDDATHVLVTPSLTRGSPLLCPISPTSPTHFVFQEQKYYLSPDGSFGRARLPVDHPMAYYAAAGDGLSDPEVDHAVQVYGDNTLAIPEPDFTKLYIQHMLAPFFVFQIFCVFLWLLDEYWHYALFTLVMLLGLEAQIVKSRIRNRKMLGDMTPDSSTVSVRRNGRWVSLPSDALVPGDLVVLSKAAPVPADVLLLAGKVVVNEAMLTGESVPQPKEPLLDQDWEHDRVLSLDSDALHIVFGGTSLVQTLPPDSASPSSKLPVAELGRSLRAPLGMVIRTGFDTSQGQLVRTIAFASERVTAGSKEAFAFIGFLLCFALAAAYYVWTKGIARGVLTPSKLALECVLIVTSVVPPELPIQLSLAVNSSLLALQKKGIFCTEPFRIPFAGKLDIACFDKTGTLTTEELHVLGVAGLADAPPDLIPTTQVPHPTQLVLGGCHSLVSLKGDVVGDPIEVAGLEAVNWRLAGSGAESRGSGNAKTSVSHVRLFHFSSKLKRMSTISRVKTGREKSVSMVLAKGAPEVIGPLLSSVPSWYWDVYSSWARKGARILALATRTLDESTHSQGSLSSMTRSQAEADLEFVGFLVLSSPLKVDSKASMEDLAGSSHRTMMITGDALLTGISTAESLGMCPNPVLTLCSSPTTAEMEWADPELAVLLSVDDPVAAASAQSARTRLTAFACDPADVAGARQLVTQYDLALSGDGYAALQERAPALLDAILPYVRVFARVTPDQKASVLASLRSLGFTTLMCGDGTNDVGALKQAHVGVALLNCDGGKSLRESYLAEARGGAQGGAGDKGGEGARGAVVGSDRKVGGGKKGGLRRRGGKGKGGGGKKGEAAGASSSAGPSSAGVGMPGDEVTIKLGDASIASPFTSKSSSTYAIALVIQQGRCTLVTTMQMYKILALNCLVNAYALSVLYLDGVKFGDTQMAVTALLVAGCFFAMSRSKPLTKMSPSRPQSRIFTPYLLISLMSQFGVHLYALMYLVGEAKSSLGLSGDQVVSDDLEADFEPNVVNNVVFLIAAWVQTVTFAVNFKGAPFMEGLKHNKPLMYLLGTYVAVILGATLGVIPFSASVFELAPWPSFDLQVKVFAVLVADAVLVFAAESVSDLVFNTTSVRI